MILEGLNAKSKFWLSLSGSGLNFCKQRLKYGRSIFLSLQNLKCLKIKNKYITEHLPMLPFRYIYVDARFSVEKQQFLQR